MQVPNPKTSKLLRRLPTSQAITRTRFEVKRSKVNVTRPVNAETESVSPIRTSNLVGGWSIRYQLPWPAIKVLYAHTVLAAPATATQLVLLLFPATLSWWYYVSIVYFSKISHTLANSRKCFCAQLLFDANSAPDSFTSSSKFQHENSTATERRKPRQKFMLPEIATNAFKTARVVGKCSKPRL